MVNIMEPIEFFSEYRNHLIILHIVAVVFGMGAALISDVLFNFYGHDKILSDSELRKLTKLSRIVWAALWVIVLSGIGIFFSNPAFYIASAKFLSKMTIVLVIVVNGYLLARIVQPHLFNPGFLTDEKERKTRRAAFSFGAISLVSWISAFSLAIPDSLPYSYVEIMSVYAILLVVGVASALQIEKVSMRG